MISLDRTSIDQLDVGFKINLINSITGAKSANLIATTSLEGVDNVAVFSSVTHLGSSPPLIGFFLRPTHEVKRDSYTNILETGFYTINPIHSSEVDGAHRTSCKFPRDVSEFDACSIRALRRPGFVAPFVKSSPIQIAMKFEEAIPINLNDTKLIIGSIEQIFIDSRIVENNGSINLDSASLVAIGGLDTYFKLSQHKRFPYKQSSFLTNLSS